MYEIIKNFNKQFEYEPQIEGNLFLEGVKNFIAVGMGGSHLAADILNSYDPSFNILVHKNYGLPNLPEETLKQSLIILNSYSGNTEEVIDSFYLALEKKLKMASITYNGKLLELSKKYNIPFVKLPEPKVQPRLALGFHAKALLKILNKEKELKEISELVYLLKPEEFEGQGRELSQKIKDKVPVIYSSERNQAIAYIWKIKFNETSKIPAFCNVLPELNHNEMTGFDVKETTRHLSQNFIFFLLFDEEDHPKIQKRMKILKNLYEERNLKVEILKLEGQNRFHKIFSSLVLADWTSFYLAKEYQVEPEEVPMVEEFKKLMEETL
jgi:glucose/mannose-6-phosphate isomerase